MLTVNNIMSIYTTHNMFCMEKKRPEHWYMHIMPVSFSIYNGVTQRARHISIMYREQGIYYDRNLFTQVLCSYRIDSSIEKQIGYFVASLVLPKNHFF